MDLSKAIQTAKIQPTNIEGVELKQLTTYPDERGFFREVIKNSDSFFDGAFGQWSHSMKYQGAIVAWHIHQKQTDWWYVGSGVTKAVVCDLSSAIHMEFFNGARVAVEGYNFSEYLSRLEFGEYYLGDNQPAQVLKIPPGVAHGLKVLQGPAHLFYITSHAYNVNDEGRIPFDALGYDWLKQEIK